MNKNDNDLLYGFFAVLIFVFLTWLITFIYTSATYEHQINRKICQQLYQYNTNGYINCNSKGLNGNIRLIKDISK